MSISAIDKEFIGYFAQLNEPQKQSMLSLLKSFLESTNQNVDAVSVAQYNLELTAAMESMDRGEFTTIEELEKEMQSW